MATQIARHFDVRLTQGAADAFVEGAITTGIDPKDGIGYKVTRIETIRSLVLSSANGNITEWSICRDSKTAVAKLNDDECLFSAAWGVRNAAGSTFRDDLRAEYSLPDGIVVVEPNIWVQLDSNLTAQAQTVDFRLWYDEVKLSEVEILRLLNNV